MRLSVAARWFDKTVCADAYNARATFKGQLNLFDDSMRDGATVVRRVLSVDDSVVIPARGAVTIHGDTYIVGANHPDSFAGEVIRRKYVLHRADGLAGARTADQALRGLAGTDLYGARIWVKDMKEIETSSRLASFLDIYVAPSETVTPGTFVTLAGRWHLVRNTFKGPSGFLVCESDELPLECLASGTYTARSGGAYDPSSDTVTGAAPATVNLLVHRWQDDFFYHRASAAKYVQGDVVARVSKANIATAVPGDSFTFAGATHRVISTLDDGLNAWTLHARRD